MAEHMKPDGRRLVSGGDPDFEVAGEIRDFQVKLDETTYRSMRCAVIRVWCQKRQRFVTHVISPYAKVIAESSKPTYKEALSDVRDQIEN